MNLFLIAALIILIPLINQIVVGSLSIYRKIKLSFGYISMLNCFGQFLSIYLASKIVAIDTQRQNVHCGMPQASMFFFGVFILIVLTVVIIIQIIMRQNLKAKH